jgi:hypothetical protein
MRIFSCTVKMFCYFFCTGLQVPSYCIQIILKIWFFSRSVVWWFAYQQFLGCRDYISSGCYKSLGRIPGWSELELSRSSFLFGGHSLQARTLQSLPWYSIVSSKNALPRVETPYRSYMTHVNDFFFSFFFIFYFSYSQLERRASVKLLFHLSFLILDSL